MSREKKTTSPTSGSGATATNCTTAPCPCKPITSIKLVSLTFKSDHNLLKDYTTDWNDGGLRFPKPEWTPGTQHPVSHNMDKQVSVEVEIEVAPANACPETGTLRGEGPDGMVFEKKGVAFNSGRFKVSLTSDKNLAKKVRAFDFEIKWSTKGTSVPISPSTTKNKMFVTYDTPYNDTAYNNGVTLKRMEWVCTKCSGDSNGHASVKKIHDSTSVFDLSASTPSPHWKIAGGAHAQCMDLAKFYMLATEMLGLRTGQVVYLYPKVGKTTKESTSGSDNERRSVSSSGHPSSTTHNAFNPNEEILLVDQNGGWNNYEACYKFTHPDTTGASKTRYYAGGADDYDTAQQVMKAVCKQTEWTFEGTGGGWSICKTPGPSPVDVW
jgi:hypothetical protein